MKDSRFWPRSAVGSLGSVGKAGTLAAAVMLVCMLAGNPAHALGLGRITVQSALGETLRAEIEVPEISAEESASLRVGVASVEAFKAAGLDYSVALLSVQVTLQKRPDGRSFLRLSSSRPITEPFVDLVLEASWASGRVVRDYTMLFDPPSFRSSTPAAAQITPLTSPQISRPPAVSTPSSSAMMPPSRAAAKPAQVAKAPLAPAGPAVGAAAPAASGQKVAVKLGDTAGKIAEQTRPASISLDQMLVALLRTNPDAFIGGNVNRLKSGVVLDIPATEQASALSPSEATSTVVAQARDFNDFRRKLASAAPSAQVTGATRQAGGQVQAKVEDRAAATATPDKLTLSKGALQGKAGAEDQIAKDKQAKDAASRVAELTKNIGDLNKMTGASPVAPAAAPASAVKPPAVPSVQVATNPTTVPAAPASVTSTTAMVSTPSVTAAAPSASAPALAASAAPVASPPVAVATASAPAPVKKPAITPPPPPPEPSLIDQLTENPLVLPGFGLLLALLAGFGFYRYKKRSEQLSVDSSFLESRLQPDSFFGASGGQRIDTSEGGGASGSSLVYSPSQLDAAGDVDPVAEADVYLAYGRDLQAEEILKEALRTNPSRVAIHAKLSEIYAKRRDLKAFAAIALEATTLTRGSGPEWAYICELGRELDPANPMYQNQPGSQAALGGVLATPESDQSAAFSGVATVAQLPVPEADASGSTVDFDLDLDFSESDRPLQTTALESSAAPDFMLPKSPVSVPVADSAVEPTVAMQATDKLAFDGLDMDFGNDPTVSLSLPDSEPQPLDNSMSFDLDPMPAQAKAKAAPVPAPASDSGSLEFDMSSLSLELDGPITESPAVAKAVPAATPAVVQSPLETKLSLAEEFRALGDSDGARSLANEVLAQAGTDAMLKSRAQAFLNGLS